MLIHIMYEVYNLFYLFLPRFSHSFPPVRLLKTDLDICISLKMALVICLKLVLFLVASLKASSAVTQTVKKDKYILCFKFIHSEIIKHMILLDFVI